MSERDPRRWSRFALSLLALLAVAVAAPLALAAAARSRFGSANPLSGADPPWRWGSEGIGELVSGPIADDTVIDGMIRLSLCVVWVALAVIVVTTFVEVIHALRHHGLGLPDVRGLGGAQRIARFIAVGLVAVLPMTTPPTSLASTLGARSTATAPIGQASAATTGVATATPVDAFAASSLMSSSTETVGSIHVVAPGESIYSIAVDLAGGDSSRVLEIADAIIDANLATVMPGGRRFTNPAYIEEGWTLRIPPGVARPSRPVERPSGTADAGVEDDYVVEPDDYVVEPGDTLWEIAGEQLGDPLAWSQIWEHNAGNDMGNGRTFDDPDLILPGWELDLVDPALEPDPVPAPAAPVAEDDRTNAPIDIDPIDVPVRAEADRDGPLPLSPTTPASTIPSGTVPANTMPGTTAAPSTTLPDPALSASTASTTTSTTVDPISDGSGAGSQEPADPTPAPEAPSPIRLEHAALVAAGLLALVGIRRRRRLRAAMPRHRVPTPPDGVTRTERRLRTIDAGERMLRVDVACRAAARSLIGSGSQIGWVEVSTDGDLQLRLTAPAEPRSPWTGGGQTWLLGADVPIEILADDARQVGQPCVALVQLGVTSSGSEVLVDLEACGVLAVAARPDQADEVVTAVATALASSQFAEVAHLVGVSLPAEALLGHRNAHVAGSADAALELAGALAGTTATNERSSFELRSLRTGGEMWEPAVVLLCSADDGADIDERGHLPGAGHGLAIVMAGDHPSAPARLVARTDGWRLDAFGDSIDVSPVGVDAIELAEITELLVDAGLELEPLDPVHEVRWADAPIVDEPPVVISTNGDGDDPPGTSMPFEPRPHEIVVGLLGSVDVHARSGEPGSFERSKTVELIAWLATHRDRATRSGARSALWDLDVRDATFANVVSEARRALARLVTPPEGEEWVARTLTEQLPVHDLVVTDADLLEDRLAHARVQPPGQALETLRPAVELVRDLPFAGTSYLWPDAEGITSNLVLLAITTTAEFAAHALSLGDTDGVFWATGKGLRVLPGHEELIALRMQAHARAGDLAGVRQEWESYERVLVADAWSDGEPAPKLLALRRELLNPTGS